MLTCEELVKKIKKDKIEKDQADRLAQADRVKAIEEEYKDDLEVISNQLYDAAVNNRVLELRNVDRSQFINVPKVDKWFVDYRKQHLDLFPKGQRVDSATKEKYYANEFMEPLATNNNLADKANKFARDIGLVLTYYGYTVDVVRDYFFTSSGAIYYSHLQVAPPRRSDKLIMTIDLYETLLDIKSMLENKDSDSHVSELQGLDQAMVYMEKRVADLGKITEFNEKYSL